MDYKSIYLMTAICNDGTIYMMRKEKKFNPILLSEYYNVGVMEGIKARKSGKSSAKYYGTKNVAKHAKEIGITYRCSVKRKEVIK